MADLVITSEHVRAARALLRWEQQRLAEASGVSLPTIKRLESKPGPMAAYDTTTLALRKAFEKVGIEFTNGDAPGVRLRPRPPRTATQSAGPRAKAASKASNLAGQQIDRLSDSSATEEQRQSRKRRLLKGPKEFRDIRGRKGKV
jgi:hypothetical protein